MQARPLTYQKRQAKLIDGSPMRDVLQSKASSSKFSPVWGANIELGIQCTVQVKQAKKTFFSREMALRDVESEPITDARSITSPSQGALFPDPSLAFECRYDEGGKNRGEKKKRGLGTRPQTLHIPPSCYYNIMARRAAQAQAAH